MLAQVPLRTAQLFIYGCTLVVWTLFPVIYLVALAFPKQVLMTEVMTLVCNFIAKVGDGVLWPGTAHSCSPGSLLSLSCIYEILRCLHVILTTQVLFSSSIMYGNYMTIAHRSFVRKIEEENQARVRMVSHIRALLSDCKAPGPKYKPRPTVAHIQDSVNNGQDDCAVGAPVVLCLYKCRSRT
jgi:hypothetical protein